MPNATINQQLARLVSAAGGIPVGTDVWSNPDVLLERVDALVINGGIDLDPASYGADPHTETDPPESDRDRFELALARGALDREMPVLGICRGMHIINVVSGGTLVQHLPDITELNHYDSDRFTSPVHEIETAEGTRAARALGPSAPVNSIHHQGIDRLGDGLQVTARASDGTIEAIENASGAVIGVQWHPEFFEPQFATDHVDLFSMKPGRPAAEAVN